jgi:hypothetical protein
MKLEQARDQNAPRATTREGRTAQTETAPLLLPIATRSALMRRQPTWPKRTTNVNHRVSTRRFGEVNYYLLSAENKNRPAVNRAADRGAAVASAALPATAGAALADCGCRASYAARLRLKYISGVGITDSHTQFRLKLIVPLWHAHCLPGGRVLGTLMCYGANGANASLPDQMRSDYVVASSRERNPSGLSIQEPLPPKSLGEIGGGVSAKNPDNEDEVTLQENRTCP